MTESTIVAIAVAVIMSLPQMFGQVVLFLQNRSNARNLRENTMLTDVLVQKTEDTEKKVVAVGSVIDAVNKKTDDQTLKIDAVNTKAEVIAGHVNSEKTAAEGREATQAVEIKLLRELLNVQDRTAALLAQSKTATPTTIQVLEKIDKHAESIETKIEAIRNGTGDRP